MVFARWKVRAFFPNFGKKYISIVVDKKKPDHVHCVVSLTKAFHWACFSRLSCINE